MADSQDAPVTVLLRRWTDGDESALDDVMPFVYNELRRLAAGQPRNERNDHTLQPTALVNEAYMRLVDLNLSWQDRTHFRSMAATTMRRVLVDHARGRRREKRGGDAVKLNIDDVAVLAEQPAHDVVDLHLALEALAKVDERPAKCLELHFFGGLGYDEIAAATGSSQATVGRDIRAGKAWIRRYLSEDSS